MSKTYSRSDAIVRAQEAREEREAERFLQFMQSHADDVPCVSEHPEECRCGDCLTYLAGEVYAPEDNEMSEPFFTHDCCQCRYVKSVVMFGRKMDIYKSCSSLSKGYIIRFSSEGSDYQTPFPESIEHAFCMMLDPFTF